MQTRTLRKIAVIMILCVAVISTLWGLMRGVNRMNAQGSTDPQEADARTIVDAVAWSPDSALVAVASGDYFGPDGMENFWVRVVNVATQQVVRTLPHKGAAHLAWSLSGQELFIGSRNGSIERYNVMSGVLQAALAGRDPLIWYSLEHMSLNPDGSRIAALFSRTVGNQEFTIYNAQTVQPLVSVDLAFTSEGETLLSWVGYSPDGTLLATTGWDGVVRIWDANTLSPLKTLSTSPGERLYAGDWSADGRLAVSGTDRRITIWNVSSEQIINSLNIVGHTRGMRWHPDGRQIATSSSGAVWDAVTGQRVQTFSLNSSEALDWSPSGVLAYGISADERIEIAPDANPLSVLASVVTVPPLPTPTPTNTPTPTKTPTPTATPTATPAPVAGLIAGYAFEEGSGTTANDVSGNNHHLTLTGGPTWGTGRYGGGLVLDGTDDRGSVANFTLPSQFTFMAWVNNPSNQSYEAIMTVGSERDLFIQDGTLHFYDGSAEKSFGVTVATGSWQHVAMTYNGSQVQAYLNGQAVGTPQSMSLGSITDTLQIGAWISGGDNADFFSGTLDEVRIYDRALAQADIETAMNTPLSSEPPGPTPTPTNTPTPTPIAGLIAGYAFEAGSGTTVNDVSGNNHHLTLTGGPTWGTGKYGGGLVLDGADDRGYFANFTLPAQFTYMAWVNNPSNQDFETIMTVGTARDWFIQDGTLHFYDGSER